MYVLLAGWCSRQLSKEFDRKNDPNLVRRNIFKRKTKIEIGEEQQWSSHYGTSSTKSKHSHRKDLTHSMCIFSEYDYTPSSLTPSFRLFTQFFLLTLDLVGRQKRSDTLLLVHTPQLVLVFKNQQEISIRWVYTNNFTKSYLV